MSPMGSDFWRRRIFASSDWVFGEENSRAAPVRRGIVGSVASVIALVDPLTFEFCWGDENGGDREDDTEGGTVEAEDEEEGEGEDKVIGEMGGEDSVKVCF